MLKVTLEKDLRLDSETGMEVYTEASEESSTQEGVRDRGLSKKMSV